MRISLSILDESPSCEVEYNPVYILEKLPQDKRVSIRQIWKARLASWLEAGLISQPILDGLLRSNK